MRHIYYLILILVFSSCNFQAKNHSEIKSSDEVSKDVDSVKHKSKDNYGLKGEWILSSYIDSVIINKAIYKFSNGFASTAYLIKFDEDTCRLFGFHENADLPLIDKTDSSYSFGYSLDQYWIIKQIDSNTLSVKEYIDTNQFKSYKPDNKEYQYKKNDTQLPIDDIKEYFIDKLFKGKYENLSNGSIVEFSNNNQINNLDSIKYYNLIIDFWDYSPGNYDVIILSKSKNNDIKDMYHWYFNGDTLNILNLVGNYDDESGFYQAEPNKVVYKLKKKK